MPYNIDGIYDISVVFNDCSNICNINTSKKLYNITDTGHIYTLDNSDNINYDNTIIKIYVNSKANYLIQPYNRKQLKTSKFNNEKPLFRQQSTLNRRYSSKNLTTSIDQSYNQQLIQKQNRVESSLYTMNLASLSSTQQDTNYSKYSHNQSDRKYNVTEISLKQKQTAQVDRKHNSYTRYLAKLKSNNLKTQIPDTKPNINTLVGNKYYKLGLIKNCNC